jgi:mono/diheme cytochrome c family protein
MKTAVAVIIVAVMSFAEVEACYRCGHNPCRIAYPTVHERVFTTEKAVAVPTDNSFRVTYNLTFPAPAASGSTVYGYHQQPYVPLDPSLFINAASRYLELSQQTAQRGFSDFNQSASLVLQGQAGIAEVQARAQLLERATQLVAATAPGSSSSITLRASRDAGGKFSWDVQPGTPVGDVQSIMTRHCVSCHQPGGRKPTPDLRDLSILDPSWEPEILDRITTGDLGRRMPPGGSLASGEIAAIYRASSICGGGRTNGPPAAAVERNPYQDYGVPPPVIERERPVPVPVPVPVPRPGPTPKKPPPEPKPEPKPDPKIPPDKDP